MPRITGIEKMEAKITRYPEGMTGEDLRRQLGIKSKTTTKREEQEFRRRRAKFFVMSDQVLGKFWSKFKNMKRSEDRLALLRKMSDVYIPNPLSYEKRRKAHGYRKRKGPCKVCADFGFHNHHIIWVRNGGHNKSSNIILLCESCHRAIHPWLPSDLPLDDDMKQTMERVAREI